MEKNTELRDAGIDIKKKVLEMMKLNEASMKKKLNKYLKENSYAQEEHLKQGGLYATPKDFLVALLEDAAEAYSCYGCSTPVRRRSKKNIRNIKYKLLYWE